MLDRGEVVTFLKSLRDKICAEFASLETAHSFERKSWSHHSGGGGEISLLKGDAFEKAAVNWSGVQGDRFPMNDGQGAFFATGVSLITHMRNPHAPTSHMNIRYIETEKGFWFGGGYDLTPMGFSYEEDTAHFHRTAQEALRPFGEHLYPQFSEQAKEYFFIPHRNKERGVGGIFFDHFHTGDLQKDYQMWRTVGESFIEAVMPIYKKRASAPFSEKDKELQNQMRAHYVEFNLVYDRGTKFGFQSGGNPEAILCSMPPSASWN